MGIVPGGTGPLAPDYVAIDPTLMDGFIANLGHARDVIGERTETIRRLLIANDLPAAALAPIGEVGQWIDEQLPELRKRSQTARMKLPEWSVGALSRTPMASTPGLVEYDETQILSPWEERRLGAELARRYLEIDHDALLDPSLGAKYQEIIDVLAAHHGHPGLAAEFFARLGPKRTLEMPHNLRRSLGSDESREAAVATLSRAFAAAFAAGAGVTGFAAVSGAVSNGGEKDDEKAGVRDLLSAGRFPTEWLVKTTPQVLHYQGGTRGAFLTPFLNALARNPEAARLAIGLATDSPLPKNSSPFPTARPDRRPDLATFLKDLNDRAMVDPGSAAAFGRLLASASGTYDERDGGHSEEAARFAFAVMTTVPGFSLAAQTRPHLAEIAGAYATEITEGADLSDDNQLLPSAFSRTESRVPGLTPAFRLSPEDTYRFISMFAGKAADRIPFESGMGDLARRLIDQGVPAMRRTGDATRLDNAFTALGNVRGFELAAAEKYAKALDDAAETQGKVQGWYRDFLLAVGGLTIPGGLTGAALWTALSTGISTVGTSTPDSESETGKLYKSTDAETLGRRHIIAQSLMDAGITPEISPAEYQATCPPGVAIADGNGKLRPFADILRSGNQGLRALDAWLIKSGMGKSKEMALGSLTDKISYAFEGSKTTSLARAKTYQ
ncbi:hypothetical protein [Microtetraspora malaysiensis]|uniref:hypothetical protein n=1 Tax=Microtetraspora malaysiensis TaxID=161358 RepID=UPI003D8F5558